MDTLEQRINYYIRYFERVLENIANMAVSEERATPVFRSILYFACLDAWAGDAFPQKRNNRKRFVKFIHKIAEWEHADRVSIPQLFDHWSKVLAGKKIHLRRLSEVYNYDLSPENASSEEDLELPKARTISDDPRIDDLIAEIGVARRACVEPFQLSNLLWDYRNSVVHRFECPGRATDVKARKKDVPYYLPCGNTLELVLPVACLQKLCQNSLAKFDRWLRERKFYPYRGSELKTSWKRSG